MLDELPHRTPGRAEVPPPKHRLTQAPTPTITELTRFADALRQWQPASDRRSPR